MSEAGTALIVGASGIAGSYLTRHLLDRGDWTVYGVSRRPPARLLKGPAGDGRFRHVAVDLLDRPASMAALGALGDVTHLFHCGYVPHADHETLIERNTRLLANAIDGVLAAGAPLRAAVLLEGTKYYGCHLGPFRTPARESDPRMTHARWFYYDQEDVLIDRQRGQPWHWSAVRPHSICGVTLGTPLNLVSIIAVYAAIVRELGLPFTFPGGPSVYDRLYQVTDADVLARGMVWAATEPACAGRAFNLTNGDLFRWCHLWPALGAFFALPVDAPRRIDLARMMADKEPVWRRIQAHHALTPLPFAAVADWNVGNYFFGADWDIVSDMTRTHQAGFVPAVDSEAMLLRLMAELRRLKVVP